MSRHVPRALLAVLLLAFSMSLHGTELVVVAPNGLSGAIAAVALRFERSVPGCKVRIVSTSADTILQHVATGANIDVLVTANLEAMDEAAARKLLINNTRRLLARDRLVLIAPAKSTLRLVSLADLLRGDLRRVAVGLPDSVASGNYARQSLEAGGLWQALYGKFVFARAASESLEMVVREEVDVGFVLQSVANAAAEQVRNVLEIDTRIPILFPIAVARSSGNEKVARSFVDFVGSSEAWDVFDQWGFLRP